MEENKQDALARAYAMLLSLRRNVDQMATYNIPETYVREFHTVLDRLEGIGVNVSEFRIPDSAVEPRITASWLEDGRSHHSYSDEKYVDKPFILTKLDAILGYFEITTSEKPKRIGFRASKNQT